MESEKCKIKIGCLLLAICYVLSAICYAQSAKELKKEREKIAKQGIETRIVKTYFYINGKDLRSNVIEKYDKEGKIVESSCRSASGSVLHRHVPKYDDMGNEIEELIYDSDGISRVTGVMEYKYDTKGNIVEELVYRKEVYEGKDLRIKRIFRYYDNEDYEMEEIECNPDGSLGDKTIYKYNKGDMVESQYYISGDYFNKCIYKYDNGIKIEKSDCLTNGVIDKKYIYKYKYDNKGNLIEETEYEVKDGKEIPQSQTVYEYTFYEESKDTEKK